MWSENFILVVSGPSGSGKSSIVTRFLEKVNDFELSISHTTRKKRAHEEDGKHYYFVSDDVFKSMIDSDAFLEWAEVYGNFYGTSKAEVERIWARKKNLLLEIDVKGAFSVKKLYQDKVVLVFVIPESFEDLVGRLKNRNTESEGELLNRINEAKNEIKHIENYDYVIINKKDGLEESAEKLINIVKAENLRVCKFWKYYKEIFWR